MTSEFRRSQHSNWEMLILKGDGASTPLGDMPAGMRSPPEQGAAEAEVGPGPVIRSTNVFHILLCVLYMYTMCITCVCPLCMRCV